MKRFQRFSIMVIAFTMMAGLVACNKKDDELVLVTTEAVTESTETTEVVTEEVTTTEELTDREKNITFQELYDANKGDTLLAGGISYSMDTVYYASGKETFSEYQFLGFDSRGMYSQAYEDSDDYVEILDAANNYWYVIEDNKLSVLIYPEPFVSAAIVDSNHNSMIFGLSGGQDGTEIVQDVYKADGKLMVETVYGNSEGVNYNMVYTLDDLWIVQEFDCYNMDGELISHSTVTEGAIYEVPAIVTQAMAMEQGYRTITVTYVDGEELDMMYYTPMDVPVVLSTIEYEAYSDQGCTVVWTESEPDENGVYKDVTIYMKKNTKEGE